MSHYALLVITKTPFGVEDLDKVLEPYCEGLEVEPYIDLTAEELVGKYLDAQDKAANDPESWQYKVQYGIEREKVDLLSMSYEDFLERYYAWGKFDEDGNLLTTYNPKSKWDWWQIGGRFSGKLLTHAGKRVDSAQIKDVDFETLAVLDRQRAKSGWEEAKTENPDIKLLIYGIGDNTTEEDYVAQRSCFATYAVLDVDGKWHEPGRMGWWGISGASPEDRISWNKNFKAKFIDTADPEWYLTVVDCHI